MWRMYFKQHETLGPWFNRYQSLRRQPSWVIKLALAAMVLVIVVPLLVLTLAAIFIGIVVFTIGSLVASVLRVMSDLFNRRPGPGHPGHPASSTQFDDGRRNVRIMRR